MNIKSFKDFTNHVSGDEKDLTNKVQIISNGEIYENSPFSITSSLEESNGLPVLICGDFEMKSINESIGKDLKVYNSFNLKKGNILNKFVSENFIPKTVKDRNNVRRLNFPIIATGKNGSNTYRSFHMFKKSENEYDSFQEKIIPKTKYEVLMFRDKPICAYEKVNDTYKDKNIPSDLYKKIVGISSRIMESHGLDVYHMKIYESTQKKYYLRGVHKCKDLDEKQANLLYIELYEDHYGYSIPTWYKNKITSLNADS
jgi:hypothetical protein